mmetsp:Transcript_16244/g.24468  ORF Transcript_16244/g.24468 Transcript_16244/m.24468 type:complete len:885 (+) Transcript_16244:140-2794(+)|eukprot:CAMPEP_0185023898 /NCGR_PEP_ID=MMETSP1103-20130426/6509_1 /TAXON_ID=36769 /ORGANISM="Paraphysomonas bandaiensis, Strain Caron Lab Isolate" /LENGTH=884 /DNA_ID=CAMNT_0027556687 /DNA_START=137 /DNA_END=2791 /DNA_ORIENTATION=-
MGKKKEKDYPDDDHEALDLSEEELEEERQDAAARYIQNAFRAKMARDLLKDMIRQNFVKLKDRNTSVYYYKNKTTGETSVKKPKILGAGDLPTPRDFQCPEDYDPGFSDADGYALLITCSKFSNERMTDLSQQTEGDHNVFEYLLSHDFICKFRGENVISLKNPTVKAFRDALDRMRRMIKKRSYLFIYICTHIVELKVGKTKDNCYVCFKDTVWRSAKQAAATSLSLSEFAHLIHLLGCDRKVIAVNAAHQKPIPKSMFKSRYLYPTEDSLVRLADLAKACVIGSCNVGTTIADMNSHQPMTSQANTRRGALRISTGAAGTSTGTTTVLSPSSASESSLRRTPSRVGEIQRVAVLAERDLSADIVAEYQKEWMRGIEYTEISATKPKQPGMRWKKVTAEPVAEGKDEKKEEPDGVEKKESRKKAKKKKTKKVEVKPESMDKEKDSKSKNAKIESDRKVADEEEEAVSELGIQLALPTTKEMIKYRLALAAWVFKLGLAPPVNYIRSRHYNHMMKTGTAPRQYSALMDRYTLFGRVICDGLSGRISPANNSTYISAMDLFLYLRREMKSRIATTVEFVIDSSGNKVPHAQDPVIFVPDDDCSAANNPVCCLCGPPAPPMAPFIIKCTANSALLEWSMPAFDGIAPTHYKIYMRNNCRLFYDWSVVPGAEFVPHETGKWRANRYNVSHLPSGVRVEFAVAAYNIGGWGNLSKASVSVIPGEELQPISITSQWKRVVKGGPLAVLDRLAEFPMNRYEHLIGLRYLVIFAQKEGIGFSRINVREKVSFLSLRCMRTFPLDNEICAPCITLIGYCIHGNMHKKLKNTLLKDGLVDEIMKVMNFYRTDSNVMNAINWLRRVMPRDIPPNCEQKLIPFGSEKKDDEDDIV